MSGSLKKRVRNLETVRRQEFGIEKILECFHENRPIPDFAPGENKIIDCLNEIWQREQAGFALEFGRP